VVEYAPTAVKKSVTGNGRASKEQVQFMVKRLLNLKEAPALDASDALAIAMCHLHSSKSRRVTGI
jgi:crossover junction endodeoxyribonuclease RuvC